MGIKELTSPTLGKKNKTEWRFDKKRELWVTWQVRAEFGGVPHVRRGFLTEAAASDYLKTLSVQNRLKEIGHVEIIKFPTVKKLFDIHRSKIESPKGRSSAKRVFTKFLKLIPKQLKINELKRKHFKDFVDERIAEGLKPESANREITDISSALHKAADYFAELENWQVPKIYRPVVNDEGRERVITKDEASSIINYLLRERQTSEREKDWKARRRTGLIFYFGLLTGLRRGEISAVEKINFDPALRRLKVERFKTKKSGVRQTIFEPLTDSQMWILSEAAKLYENGKFFFSEHGKPHNKFYEIMEACCTKLKIEYGKDNPNGFVLHDTRHTFVTVLEHGSIDSSTTRSFSGHSKDSMMKRYAHATPDSRSRAMQLIERELGSQLVDNQTDLSEADKKLLRLFQATQNKKITFDDFKTAVESFYGFFTSENDSDVQNVQIVQ